MQALSNCFLCRNPDDQLAVTIPAAIYAPEKSWNMRTHEFDLKVFHNLVLDGQEFIPPPKGFTKYWPHVAAKDLPTAKVCSVTERDR